MKFEGNVGCGILKVENCWKKGTISREVKRVGNIYENKFHWNEPLHSYHGSSAKPVRFFKLGCSGIKTQKRSFNVDDLIGKVSLLGIKANKLKVF